MVRRVLPRLFLTSSITALLCLGLVSALCLSIQSALPTRASAATYAPVAEYSFDEIKTEGGVETVEDLSGDGHTATVEGATAPPGRYGPGLSTGGGGCATVTDVEGLQPTEEFTFEAWLRYEGEGEVAEPFLTMEDPGAPEGHEQFSWMMLAGGEESPKAWLRDGEELGFEGIYGVAPIPRDAWTHLALTDDGAHLRLYVDGELVRTAAAPDLTTASGPLRLGCGLGYHFEGRIDEVRLYDRVLGGSEVAADMETPIQTPRSGPVAEYSFDQDPGEGTTIEDLSGHGHTATIEGAGWTSHGRYGGAMEFDGEEDCLKVPYGPELQMGEELTVEAWARPTSEGLDAIVTQEDEEAAAGEEGYAWSLLVGGVGEGPRAWFRLGGEAGHAGVYGTEPEAHGAWTHVAVTDDGAHYRLYIDGVLVGTNPAVPLTSSHGPLTIGCLAGYGNYFEGRVDEVRIYDRALDGGEVDIDMETPIQTPRKGPVADYSFDEVQTEGETHTVEDLSGDGHTATLHGATFTEHGRYGGALEFDAAKEQYVSIPADAGLDGHEELTVEAWVRPTDTPYIGEIAMKEREGPGAGYSWTLDQHSSEPVGYFMQSGEGMVAGGEGSLPLDTWTHVAMTDDGAHTRLYVDGQLVDTEPAVPFDGHGPIKIGGNSLFGQWFDGRIDELRIYERALGGAEVALDMESPLQTPKATPVAAYAFDEGEGETVQDVTGDGHTATIEGAEWARGRYGGALKLDGESTVTIPASEDLDLTEEFTLEAWIRPEAGCTFGQIFVKEDAEEAHAAYVVSKHGSKLGAYLGVPGVEEESPSGTLEIGAWQHIAVTFDGSKATLYVDGEEVGTAPVADILSTGGDLRLGGSNIGSHGGAFVGRIDEVRIYGRALNGAEVVADMEAPIQTPQQGPIAAWSFDEIGEGGTVEDVTGNKHTGTVEGAVAARGKYGQALQFDGVDDVVKAPSSPEFALTEGFTLEAWVRPESESNEWAPILAKEIGGGEAATELAWWLYEGGWDSNMPYGGTEPTPGNRDEAHANDPLPVDAWSHLALTYDGAKIRLYINGELADCSPVPAGAPPVTTGELQIGGVTEHGEYFKGRIDEVRIYDRALSAAEIQGTRNSTIPIAVTSVTTEVGSNDAFMTGTASVNGPEAEYFFEYGPTESYDAIADGEEITGDGEEIQLEEAAVNLAPEQTYHYRLVVESPLGTFHGKDKTFTTGSRTISVQEEEEEDAPVPTALTSDAEGGGKNPFFGVDWSGDLAEMVKQHMFARIAESGAEYVRFGVNQQEGEAELRQAFAAAKANGLIAVPYIGESAPQIGDEGFFKFARRIVEEFGPSYGNDYWEIGNEPNRPPLEEEKEANARDKDFATYYEEMYNYIKSAGDKVSGLKFLSPGLYGFRGGRKGRQSPQRFLEVFNADIKLPNPYSAISVHPYVFEVRNPEKLKASPGYCPHPRTAAHKPVAPCDYEQAAIDMEGIVRKSRRGAQGMQIWVTEYGFPVESHEKGIPSFGYSEQAALVKESSWRFFRRRKRLHLDHAMIYNIQDNYKFEFGKGPKWAGHCGLFDPQAHQRPSWRSFEQIVGLH